MLRLNLASNKLKQEIKLRHVYRFLITANCVLILLIIFLAIVILTAKIIMQNNFNKVIEETTLISRTGEVKNVRIKEINSQIGHVESIQSGFHPWSFVLEEIARFANNEIVFSSIKINAETMQLDLSGHSLTRQSLLDLKDGLEESEYFTNLEFPLKNILEKGDINFNIKAQLATDKIKLSENE